MKKRKFFFSFFHNLSTITLYSFIFNYNKKSDWYKNSKYKLVFLNSSFLNSFKSFGIQLFNKKKNKL